MRTGPLELDYFLKSYMVKSRSYFDPVLLLLNSWIIWILKSALFESLAASMPFRLRPMFGVFLLILGEVLLPVGLFYDNLLAFFFKVFFTGVSIY